MQLRLLGLTVLAVALAAVPAQAVSATARNAGGSLGTPLGSAQMKR